MRAILWPLWYGFIHPMRILPIITLLLATEAQFLPPEAFDKPYEGRLYYELVPSQEHVRKACPGAKFSGPALACTICFAGMCVIVIVSDEEIRAAGHTRK
jgi:hypothetical protein